MKDYDVHFLFSGFLTIEAESAEEARSIGNRMLDMMAFRIRDNFHLDIVDTDQEYATDVLSVSGE